MLDFEDVLLATAGMIESEPSVAMQVRESYRHFIVDEYQDVSPAQQQLLDLWLGGRRDLCVVGDAEPDHLLLRRGDPQLPARLRAPVRGRHGRAPRAQLPVDERDRRPRQPADARPGGRAPAGVGRRCGCLGTGDARAATTSPEPSITEYADELAEARGVATRIRARIDAGAPPESIAVLMRVNSQSAILERALDEVGVGSACGAPPRFFDQPEVREAVHALRAAALTIAGEPLFKSVSDVLRALGWTAQAPDGPGAVRARWESLNAIARLVDDYPPGTTFRTFADDLGHGPRRSTSRRSRRSRSRHCTRRRASSGTRSSSSGLNEGMLPIAYAKGFDAIDEERRLLYVGITRARRRLELSWARRVGHRGEREPSRFLQELGTRTRDAADDRAAAGGRPARRG